MAVDGLLIELGSFDLFIHQSILIWLVVLIFVGGLLIFAGKKFKAADPTKPPTRFIVVFEQLYKIAITVIGGNLNKRTWKYLPFMGTTMVCMVISNLIGLIGFQSPTSNLSVNATLALIVFFMIHGTNVKEVGIKGKIKAWAEPMAFLFPLNVIGDLAFPLSLTLRLFGNMLGGSIIVALLYTLVKAMMPFGVVMFAATPFLHMYFDVFTAFMQTYIFFTLASFFLSEAINTD